MVSSETRRKISEGLKRFYASGKRKVTSAEDRLYSKKEVSKKDLTDDVKSKIRANNREANLSKLVGSTFGERGNKPNREEPKLSAKDKLKNAKAKRDYEKRKK